MATGEVEPLGNPWQEFWKSHLPNADALTQTLLEAFPNPPPTSLPQQEWLDAASRSFECYLRSPPFLAAMKHSIDSLIRSQRQLGKPLRIASTSNEWNAREIPPWASLGQLWDPLPESFAILDSCVGATSAPGSPRRSPDAVPGELMRQQGTWKLLRYQPVALRCREPVVVCCSLVNRPGIVDLQPDRSVIRRLLEQGLEVYLLDWGVPTAADHTLRLQDYVCGIMAHVVDWVCDTAQSAQVHLLGYCMGGTLATMFTSLHQHRVRTLILMAAPIDFGRGDGLLSLWTRGEYFDVDGLIDAFGNCPGSFLQACFQAMRPVQNFVQKYLMLYEKRSDRAFVENFLALERWAHDSVPVAGDTFREFVHLMYRQNLLVQGQMRLDGQAVRLGDITCPLLLLTADLDHLVPPTSTLALRGYVSSSDAASMQVASGHIGLAVSSKAHRQLWPDAAKWIAVRSSPAQLQAPS